MIKGQFKGFQDIVIRDGLWSFKGETVWSGNITELWKYVRLSIEKDEHKHQVSMGCTREAATETERERILKEGDSFFIGKQYGEDDLTNEEYDKLVKLWEEFKLKQSKEE